jgi:DNA-directed RNA polymerase sigma subunit (sigma70/sigma32)
LEELHARCKESTVKELKKASIKDIEEAILHGGKMPSLQEKVSDNENEDELKDVLEDKSLAVDSINRTESLLSDLDRFLYHLTQMEYDTLILATGLNEEPAHRNLDVAKALKVREKDIVRMKTKAVKKLKKLKNIGTLRDYLE